MHGEGLSDSPASEPPITVLVADDHELFRRGICDLLAEQGFKIVGQAGDGQQAIALAERRAPDVIVMDLKMPGISGIEATAAITETLPSVGILMLTIETEQEQVVEALLAGASGYLIKDARIEDIVAGVRAAAEGDSVISPTVASALVGRIRRQTNRARDGRDAPALTEREGDVLRLVADGRSNQEIADALVISQPTVKHHISSIISKLGVENRVQAAIEAIRRGLV